MRLPALTKEEALKLECVRIAANPAMARELYEFITEKTKVVKKPVKKAKRGL